MGVNFTPEMGAYTGQGAFRFWCQKVLPLVYDDSLSYYELLNKVVNYLNNVIKDVATVEENVEGLLNTYNQLQDYVNNYFDNLDVQHEINTKLDLMVSDGTFTNLIEPIVNGAVSEWLNENVDPVGSAVIVDSSLTIPGAAADAKVVGRGINELNKTLNRNKTATPGYILTATDEGNGARWTPFGLPSDEQTAAAVSAWLDEHPEATTTVADNSLTYNKLVRGTMGFVTPEMYGAKGDGVTDDTPSFVSLIEEQSEGKIIILEGDYLISETLKFPEKSIVCGKGKILSNLETPVYIALSENSAISGVSLDGVGVDLSGTNVIADNLYIISSKDRGINVRADVTIPAQNIKVSNVRVVNPKSHGFTVQNNTYVSSENRTNAIIDSILFENCSFINQYDASFTGAWQVGFGVLCTGSKVKNVVFRDCYSSGAAESGFHCEFQVSVENMVYDHCISINNGQKANAEYGAGFLIPSPDNAKANYYHCFTKGNVLTLIANSVLKKYGALDITDIDSGFSVKNMVITGNGSVLMHGDRVKAYSARQYTNLSTAATYRPRFFMSPAQCYTFKDGVYEMFANDEKSALWCSPIFPINPSKQIKIDAVLKQNVAVPSSIRFYLIFFDGNMNNLGNKQVTVKDVMSDETEYPFSNTFSNTYPNAVYAMIEINPRYVENTSLTTIKNIVVTEV